MFTLIFWAQTLERAIKTFAQAASTLLIVDGLNVFTVDWANVGSIAGLAAVLSILTSLATAGIGQHNSPSAIAVSSEREE